MILISFGWTLTRAAMHLIYGNVNAIRSSLLYIHPLLHMIVQQHIYLAIWLDYLPSFHLCICSSTYDLLCSLDAMLIGARVIDSLS
jgi:hypothetical protein